MARSKKRGGSYNDSEEWGMFIAVIAILLVVIFAGGYLMWQYNTSVNTGNASFNQQEY